MFSSCCKRYEYDHRSSSHFCRTWQIVPAYFRCDSQYSHVWIYRYSSYKYRYCTCTIVISIRTGTTSTALVLVQIRVTAYCTTTVQQLHTGTSIVLEIPYKRTSFISRTFHTKLYELFTFVSTVSSFMFHV
jgi:hypothetical protein